MVLEENERDDTGYFFTALLTLFRICRLILLTIKNHFVFLLFLIWILLLALQLGMIEDIMIFNLAINSKRHARKLLQLSQTFGCLSIPSICTVRFT